MPDARQARSQAAHRESHAIFVQPLSSFALTGDYVPDSDEHAIRLTPGYSTDHRPDLKQAVLELMVSQDVGVPFVRKSWGGNTSDTQVFRQRAEALLSAFQDTPTARYPIADAEFYCEDNAVHLAQLCCSTRMPATLKVVSQVMSQALQWDTWQPFDDTTRSQPLALCHSGMAQRWLGVSSRAALERAEATLQKPKSGHTRPSTSSSFICKPNALAHPKLLTMPSQRWPSTGSITALSPLI